MEKIEKPLRNSPFMPFYAMNHDHRIMYVAAYLDILTCLFSHTRINDNLGSPSIINSSQIPRLYLKRLTAPVFVCLGLAFTPVMSQCLLKIYNNCNNQY